MSSARGFLFSTDSLFACARASEQGKERTRGRGSNGMERTSSQVIEEAGGGSLPTWKSDLARNFPTAGSPRARARDARKKLQGAAERILRDLETRPSRMKEKGQSALMSVGGSLELALLHAASSRTYAFSSPSPSRPNVVAEFNENPNLPSSACYYARKQIVHLRISNRP